MNEPLTRKKTDTSAKLPGAFSGKLKKSAQVVADAVRSWWKMTDTYQQRARGWAVTGFVFSLLNLFSIGFLPPLSYLAIVFCVFALFRGNRAFISLLGIGFGILGIMLSTHMYHTLLLYYTDGAAFKSMLEGIMTIIQSTIASLT